MGATGEPRGKRAALPSGGATKLSYDAPFRGFINVNLTDEQKALYEDWSSDVRSWQVIQEATADGVNLALKIDPKSSGFLASATQRRTTSVNAGLVVTARGRDSVTAWLRLLFLLDLMGVSEAWEATQAMADPDRW